MDVWTWSVSQFIKQGFFLNNKDRHFILSIFIYFKIIKMFLFDIITKFQVTFTVLAHMAWCWTRLTLKSAFQSLQVLIASPSCWLDISMPIPNLTKKIPLNTLKEQTVPKTTWNPKIYRKLRWYFIENFMDCACMDNFL